MSVPACMDAIIHQTFLLHARLGSAAEAKKVMRHAALEPRHACDGLHRQGNDEQVQQEVS